MSNLIATPSYGFYGFAPPSYPAHDQVTELLMTFMYCMEDSMYDDLV